MTDYSEILLQSVQTLIDKSLADLPSDKNVVCTITDNTNRKVGQYKASSNNVIIYDVYSEKDTYKVGDQVVVLFPQDDTQHKTILSKYIETDAQQPVAYVPPSDKSVQVTSNLAKGFSGSITANNESVQFIELGTIMSPELKDSKFYDTIYLKADFTCFLSSYDIRSGHYGILIEGYTSSAETASPVAIMQLDSDQMFGNPFAFIAPFSQEILFHYNIEDDFAKLKVYLYQSNDFTYFDGVENKVVPAKWSEPITGANNIIVSNMNIYIAYDVVSVADNTVKIITKDNLAYGAEDGLNKQIELIWYNKTEDNKFLGFTDGIFSEDAKKQTGTIKTKSVQDNGSFSYTINEAGYAVFTSETEYVEGDQVFFTKSNAINATGENTIIGLANSSGNSYYWIEWLVDNANGTLAVAFEGSAEKYNATCRLDLSMTEVQAKVWCNGQSYVSNIIQFKNQDINANNIENLGIELSFEHIEPGYSTYALYGADNQLLQSNQASVRRKIRAIWKSRVEQDIADSFWERAIITWGIPKIATMITPVPTMTVSKETDEYYYYEFPYKEEYLTFNYLIKKVYIRNYSNNTITCAIKLPQGRGTVYGAEKITFSSLGSNGTDYTFVLDTVRDGFPWYAKNGNTISLKATLRDADNKELPVNDITISRVGGATLDKSSVTTELKDLSYFNLMKAICSAEWGGRLIDFETYLPLNYSKDGNYVAQAPSTILYNTLGTLQDSSVGAPLKLINLSTNKEMLDIAWKITYQANNKRTGAVLQESKLPSEILSWVPTVKTNSVFIGKMLEDGYASFVGTSEIELTEDGQMKYGLSIDDLGRKIIVFNSIEGPATLLGAYNQLQNWTYKDEENIKFNTYTTDVKEDAKFYTIFQDELYTNFQTVARDISKESKWGKVAFTYVDFDVDQTFIVAINKARYTDENGDYYGEFQLGNETKAVYRENKSIPEFTPGIDSKYIIYKKEEKYYFLTVVPEDVKLELGEYHWVKGININSTIQEYRYLFSTLLKGNRLPSKDTHVYFDNKLQYTGIASIEDLALGVYSTYSINPATMYMDTGYLCTLQAIKPEPYNQVLWSQPLPVQQYRYGSALLNNWDGNLKVDNDNNYILSAMMGAGIKNSDNTFSGVLMGDVGTKLEDGSLQGTIGLYGYNKGEQSFGFKVDGTAFLGKSGRGQIQFDGNNGIIKSADETSMVIDLDDGIIRASKFLLDARNKYMRPYEPELAPIDSGTWLAKQASITTLDDRISAISGWGSVLTCKPEPDNIIKCSGVSNDNYPYYVLWWQGLSENLKYQNLTLKDQIQVTCKFQTPASLKTYLAIWYRQVGEEDWNILSTVATPGSGDSKFKTLDLVLSNLEGDYEIQAGVVSKPFSGGYIRTKDLSIVFQRADTLIAETIIRLSNQNKNDSDVVMHIGEETQNFLKLTQGGQLAINAKKIDFTVDNNNFIKIDDDGLKIKATDFSLNAGEWNEGNAVFVNSGGYLLAAGKTPFASSETPSWDDEDACGQESYLRIKSSGIQIHTKNFRLEPGGDLKLRGSIDVSEGSTIAGWYVGESELRSTNGTAGISTTGFWLGGDRYNAPFRVNVYGQLYASGAIIDGSSFSSVAKLAMAGSSSRFMFGSDYDGEIPLSPYFRYEGNLIELRHDTSDRGPQRGRLAVQALLVEDLMWTPINDATKDDNIDSNDKYNTSLKFCYGHSSAAPANPMWVWVEEV